MNDKWEIYDDAQGNWRWRRVAGNGRIVGASTESYRNRADLLANARRNGYGGNKETFSERPPKTSKFVLANLA